MNASERLFALKVSLIMSVRMLGLFMLFPVMSVYAGDYDSSTPFLIGMSIGIYGLTQALLQIPFGYLSDRFGRKPILIIGLLIFLLGSIVAANASNIILEAFAATTLPIKKIKSPIIRIDFLPNRSER